jgi:hypothetical protein
VELLSRWDLELEARWQGSFASSIICLATKTNLSICHGSVDNIYCLSHLQKCCEDSRVVFVKGLTYPYTQTLSGINMVTTQASSGKDVWWPAVAGERKLSQPDMQHNLSAESEWPERGWQNQRRPSTWGPVASDENKF